MTEPHVFVADRPIGAEIGTAETWTALAADVRSGLTAAEKSLPAKWFYDARGSQLFDRICEQPEYYLTRAEAELLARRGDAIAASFSATELIELGSGSSTKTPLLLGPLVSTGSLTRYVPVDVSAAAMAAARPRLCSAFPGLRIKPLILDFTTQLELIGDPPPAGGRLVVLLGSTIGNLDPAQTTEFLRRVRTRLGPDDALLLGTDLVKDESTLTAAYDDAAGVTAEFNRNVLAVVNRELGADFVPTAFEHVATWNPVAEQIESRLRSRTAQQVRIEAISLDVSFRPGESIFTEISRKFRRETVAAMYHSAGFELSTWLETAGVYAVSLARPV